MRKPEAFLEQFMEADSEIHFEDETSLDSSYRLVMAVTFIGCMAGLVFWRLASSRLQNTSSLIQLILNTSPFQIFAFLPALFILLAISAKRGFRKTFDIPEGRLQLHGLIVRTMKLTGCVFPLFVLVNFITSLLFHWFGLENHLHPVADLGKNAGASYWIFTAFSSIVLAPIAEETLLRLVCFRAIRSFMPVWSAFLTAMIFAVMHGIAAYVPGYFLLGLGLQFARKKGGLPLSILMHAMHNTIAFMVIMLST